MISTITEAWLSWEKTEQGRAEHRTGEYLYLGVDKGRAKNGVWNRRGREIE